MRVYQIDAFTEECFKGNPAGIVLSLQALPEAWMQTFASEMNLSETAFLWPIEKGFEIRFFTPSLEVPLCGHATVAAAHIIYETGLQKKGIPIALKSKGGDLKAWMEEGGIAVDFPRPVLEAISTELPWLTYFGEIPPIAQKKCGDWYLLEYESPETIRMIKPDLFSLKTADPLAIVVTSKGDKAPFDMVSRVFAPRAGIPEDPVTGYAHTILGVHFSQEPGPRKRQKAFQASARGGEIGIELFPEKVRIFGKAVTVFQAILSPDALPK